MWVSSSYHKMAKKLMNFDFIIKFGQAQLQEGNNWQEIL